MAARLHKARPPRDPEAIPLELRSIPRWVVWDFFPPKPDAVKKKLGKVPLDAGRDTKADYTNSDVWRSFDDVLAEARQRGDVGVGFVFADTDDVVGVDLDDAYLPTGELKPWAREILDRFGSTWAEKSVSGTGVHFIGRGDRILGKKRVDLVPAADGIERYSERRFFTVSGDVIQAAPLADVRQAMAWLEERHFRPPAAPAPERQREAAPGKKGVDFVVDHELDRELARVCLEHLKASRAHDGDDWRRVGVALKTTSEDLLEDWVSFSKRWPDCSEEECRDRWRRLSPTGNLSLGSLVHMAAEDSGKAPVDLVREAKARLGRNPGATAPTPAPKKTPEEIDREERLEAARYGVETSGVLCLVLASDPKLELYRECGLGRAGDVVAVPELTRQDWARISKAFPGARVQLVSGDLGDEAFRNSCRSLLGTKAAPEAVVVVGPEAWEGRDDLPSWLDDNGLPDPALVLAERARPAAVWLADDLLAAVSPASLDPLRREAVDRVLDAVAACRGPRAALDVEDLLHRASESTGYSREALEGLISAARERAEAKRARERIARELGEIAETAGGGKGDPAEIVDRARAALDEISTHSAAVPLPPVFDVRLVEAEARLVRPGFSTGWAELDASGVRLRPKELVGVAARPGQGKTSVLVWLAWRLLEQVDDGAVVVVSHEETKVSILYRLFALAAAELVPEETVLSTYRDSRRWNRGDVREWLAGTYTGRGMTKEKVDLFARAREIVVEKARRLVVIEERGAGADRVAKLCRAVHDAHGCRAVAVDYLQRLPHDGPDLAKGRRDMETAWACRRLREGIALPFDCPVVVAAQVNREGLRDGWARRLLEALDPSKKPKGRRGDDDDGGIEERIRRIERVLAEARPAPHMLRDGGIEHEADLIIGTHNPSADMAWDKEKRRAVVDMVFPGNETPLAVGVLKNRSGPDGEWHTLTGDYGAGYFVSSSADAGKDDDRVGMISADEWDPDANPYG